MPSPQNRRRSPRYTCHHPIVVVLQHGQDSVFLDGECRTLSRGGFGAVVAGNLDPGRIVSIHFKPSRLAQPISLRARVIYTGDGLHGFEFIAPDEQHREAVATLFREAVAERQDDDEAPEAG